MSRDPFEEMQRRNPVTSDELPVAPMSVAERILGARTARVVPGWALAAAAMVVVAVMGGGMLLWLGGGDAAPVGAGTSTTAGPTTSSPDTSVPGDVDLPASVYFLADIASDGWAGPFLVPVTRMIDSNDTVGEAMALLIGGPHDDESGAEPAITSAIPAGTRFLSASVEAGVVTIDLSAEFVSGGGSFSMGARVAQVVATLTALDGIDSVKFEVEGVPTTVFGGEGVTIPEPATRADVEAFLPAVMIESPAWGADGGNPLVVTGTANVFEATVSIELLDASGALLFEGFTTASCGTGCRGAWEIEIPYEVNGGQYGTLRAFESSAEDGEPVNVREHRVWLYAADGPADTTTTSVVPSTCSGSLVLGDLTEQPGLPALVAEKRAAIWDAAVECDWDQLQRLLASSFAYSYGGQDASIDAPIHYWQGLEDAGEDPIRFLGELLNQPFGTLDGGEGLTYYVWPSVHTKGWEEVTQAEREALRVLYDDADLAGFADFGAYYGYRIGILSNGDWMYFIAGD